MPRRVRRPAQQRFTPGEIVKIPHVALALDPRPDTETSHFHYLPRFGTVVAKTRPAIVIVATNTHILCLPIYTIHAADVFQRNFRRDLQIVCVDLAREPRDRSEGGEIERVVRVWEGTRLDHAGYVKMGDVVSLECRSVVGRKGRLAEGHAEFLVDWWKRQFGVVEGWRTVENGKGWSGRR